MSNRLLVRFRTFINGGGVLTFVGDKVAQAVYWEANCYDPFKDSWWPPVGQLANARTKTDKSSLSTNVYHTPTRQPRQRWGTGYTWGEKKWAEDWYVNDSVTVKWTD